MLYFFNGSNCRSRGKGYEHGVGVKSCILMQFITDTNDSATINFFQALVAAFHAVAWTRESLTGSFGGT